MSDRYSAEAVRCRMVHGRSFVFIQIARCDNSPADERSGTDTAHEGIKFINCIIRMPLVDKDTNDNNCVAVHRCQGKNLKSYFFFFFFFFLQYRQAFDRDLT